MNLHIDDRTSEKTRRRAAYSGAIYLHSGSPELRLLADFARAILAAHFHPLEPAAAQLSLDVRRFVEIIGQAKTEFTNHAQTKTLLTAFLRSAGFDVERTYFDVPRLRVVTADGYLRAGVGYAYRPHRDTWYAAPNCQMNWWLPLNDLVADQALVFYPRYFAQAVPNTSREFDYAQWQATGRPQAKNMITYDSRNHPLPLAELSPHDEFRVVMPADSLLQFSAAQLHATADNRSGATRFSIDFRTFDRADLAAGRGAENVDNAAVGSTVADFYCAADLSPYAAPEVPAQHA